MLSSALDCATGVGLCYIALCEQLRSKGACPQLRWTWQVSWSMICIHPLLYALRSVTAGYGGPPSQLDIGDVRVKFHFVGQAAFRSG